MQEDMEVVLVVEEALEDHFHLDEALALLAAAVEAAAEFFPVLVGPEEQHRFQLRVVLVEALVLLEVAAAQAVAGVAGAHLEALVALMVVALEEKLSTLTEKQSHGFLAIPAEFMDRCLNFGVCNGRRISSF
jgi:hypothetical protein